MDAAIVEDIQQIVIDEEPYTYLSLLQKYGKIPISTGKKCLIIGNSTGVSEKKLRMYFQNPKRSGGGKIRKFVKMMDGILVEFDSNDIDVEAIIKREHQLDGRKIAPKVRTIPDICRDRFILDGVISTDLEELSLFVENCDEHNREPSDISKCKDDRTFLIKYLDSFGEELEEILQRIKTESPTELGCQVKPKYCFPTNCICLTGDGIGQLSLTFLEKYFKNEKRTAGRDVTCLKRCKTGCVLVYFAEHEVAEEVCKKFSTSGGVKLTIKNVDVKVQLYYHDLSSDHHHHITEDQLASTSTGSKQSVMSSPDENAEVKEEAIMPISESADQHANTVDPGSKESAASGPDENAEVKEEAVPISESIKIEPEDEPYTWSSLHQRYSKMPIRPGKKCLVVAKSQTTVAKLRLHFENRMRSGSDKVINLVEMWDGYLIELKDSIDIESLVKRTHTLDGKLLDVKVRTVPCIYLNQFALQGVPNTDDDELLSMLLESCDCESKKFRKPCKLVKGDEPGAYLVYYDEALGMDMESIFALIRNQRIIEDCNIMPSYCAPSNCVRVTGEHLSDVNDSYLLQIFNLPTRTAGRDVIQIVRCTNQCVLIYFAECAVAEQVVQNGCAEGMLKIKDVEVEVSIYHHEISTDHKQFADRSTSQQSSGYDDVPVDTTSTYQFTYGRDDANKDVIQLVKHFYNQELQTVMHDVAVVNFKLDECGIVLVSTSNSFSNHNAFVERCKHILQEFLKKFTSKEVQLDAVKLVEVRQEQSWNQDVHFIKLPDSEISCSIRFNKDGAVVTCFRSNIEKAIKIIDELCAVDCSHAIHLDPSRLRILEDTGFIEKQEKLGKKLKLSIDRTTNQLHMKGPQKLITMVNQDYQTYFYSLEKIPIVNLDENVTNYLVQEVSKSSDQFRSAFRELLAKQSIKVCLSVTGESISAYLNSGDDCKKLEHILKEGFNSIQLDVDDAIVKSVLITAEWRDFTEKVSSNRLQTVFSDVKSKHVAVVGFDNGLREAADKVKKYIDDNAMRETTLTLGVARVQYLLKFDDATKTKLNGVGVVLQRKSKTLESVIIRGKSSSLRKAEQTIQQAVSAYITPEPLRFNDAGHAELFKKDNTKTYLQLIEKQNRCIMLCSINDNNASAVKIATDAVTTTTRPKAKPQNSTATTPTPPAIPNALLSAIIKNCGVAINLYRANIVAHPCDAIVNPSNADLELGKSGISASLLREGGAQIQDELHQKRKNISRPIVPGDAVITESGDIKSCKHIIHAVGPTWTDLYVDNVSHLRACVKEALMLADNAKANSIAIPAISCGNYGGRSDICTKMIVVEIIEVVQSRSLSSVQKVDLIEMSNETTLQDFTKALCNNSQVEIKRLMTEDPSVAGSMQPSTSSSGQGSKLPDKRSSSFTVSVYKGDIAKEKSDVLVNSANSDFDLSKGAVSKTILKNGGQSIQAECSDTNRLYSSPTIRVSSGGLLPCKHIIHLAINNQNTTGIQNTLEKALEICEKLSVNSISIPALGTGVLGKSASDIANAMGEAFNAFVAKRNTQHLTRANVVVYESSMLAHFRSLEKVLQKSLQQQSVNLTQNNPTKKTGGFLHQAFQMGMLQFKDWFTDKTNTDNEKRTKSGVTVQFCSGSQQNITQAEKQLLDHVTKSFVTTTIENEDTLERFTHIEMRDVGEIQHLYDVDMKFISKKSGKVCQFTGLPDKVLKAQTAVIRLIADFKAAEPTSKSVVWGYIDPVSHEPTPFHVRAIYQLESAHKDAKTDMITVQTLQHGAIEVDVRGDKGIIREYKSEVKIYRKDTWYPDTWTPMIGQDVIKEKLDPNSVEYKQIMSKFEANGTSWKSSVIQLERIQNKVQYRQFLVKRDEVKKRMERDGTITPATPVERDLFHGTSESVCENIEAHGFDRGFSGLTNAMVYGKGVYFAVDAEYSGQDLYAKPNDKNERRMFICRVITGEYCKGQQEFITPPPVPGKSKTDLYDSVVNDVNNPKIFVIFKDASVYATHLLTYKK